MTLCCKAGEDEEDDEDEDSDDEERAVFLEDFFSLDGLEWGRCCFLPSLSPTACNTLAFFVWLPLPPPAVAVWPALLPSLPL